MANINIFVVKHILMAYAFFYPFFMAWIWMFGGLVFYLKWERRKVPLEIFTTNNEPNAPLCSIVIPCFNEELNLRETLHYALQSNYPNLEVIAIDDGSSDGTWSILCELVQNYSRLRIFRHAANEGKAMALRTGAAVAHSDYLVCIDGDALLHPDGAAWIMHHLTAPNSRVGAVTGNPRIMNRSTILGKVQVGEFSSIIGLVKRAQKIYGRVFTVSGVIAGFRRTALASVGFWSDSNLTEDIDISWRLQMNFWDIRFEPRALCYIYMPETFKGLWKQRLRWAKGGVEVVQEQFKLLLKWRKRRFWGIIIEYVASVFWAYTMLAIMIIYFIGLAMPLPRLLYINSILPEWYGVMLGLTCLFQFFVSITLDSRYESKKLLTRVYFWVIWYPLLFWVLNMFTVVWAVPAVLFSKRRRARWVSPDRGFQKALPNAD